VVKVFSFLLSLSNKIVPFLGQHEEFPADWFTGLVVQRDVASPKYRNEVNKYGVYVECSWLATMRVQVLLATS
jgi:hypothetical protein